MKFTIHSLEELKEIAEKILNKSDHKIFTLKGNLGSGKTTFVKTFCELINCQDEITSPTFSIVNEYIYPSGKIYHFDLYRINSIEELFNIGIEEYIDSGNYCFIEWPKIYEAELPEHHEICLSLKNKTRIITFN